MILRVKCQDCGFEVEFESRKELTGYAMDQKEYILLICPVCAYPLAKILKEPDINRIEVKSKDAKV